MLNPEQKKLPKFKCKLGLSNDVIISLREDENSAQRKMNGLKSIGAISSAENLKADTSNAKFDVSIPSARYALLQKVFNYPESINTQYGMSQYRPKQFIFSEFDKAFEFCVCLRQAGFQPFEEIDYSTENKYIVRIPEEFGKIYDCLLPCFSGQGKLNDYLALENFYHRILEKHEVIFENPDLPNNELLKALSGIFTLSLMGEDKFLMLWEVIKHFKKNNGELHADLAAPEVKALISDIEKIFQLEVDMSLNDDEFKKQLTLETKKTNETQKEKTPTSIDAEKSLCQIFFQTHDTFLKSTVGSTDQLRSLLGQVFVNHEISDEDKIRAMELFMRGFNLGMTITNENLRSFSFTKFSEDLTKLVDTLNQSTSVNTALSVNDENISQFASSSSSSSSSSSGSLKLDNPSASNGQDNPNLNIHEWGSSFWQGQSESPTHYSVNSGQKIPVKRPFDEMKQTDAPKLNDKKNDQESKDESEEKKRKLNNDDPYKHNQLNPTQHF